MLPLKSGLEVTRRTKRFGTKEQFILAELSTPITIEDHAAVAASRTSFQPSFSVGNFKGCQRGSGSKHCSWGWNLQPPPAHHQPNPSIIHPPRTACLQCEGHRWHSSRVTSQHDDQAVHILPIPDPPLNSITTKWKQIIAPTGAHKRRGEW